MYLEVPMMSSRYSRRPSLCSVGALGFICAMDSTSHCRREIRMGSRNVEDKTYLKDKELFVVQVNAALFKVAHSVIDGILAQIILEHRARNNEVQVRDYFVRVR